MAKATLQELLARADSAIARKEAFIYDVAANTGQIVDNVARMTWFRCEVADHLIATTEKWSGLQAELNQWRP